MNKEAGGVTIALLGFVALTLAFKGTWTNVWDALTGHSPTAAAATGATSSGGSTKANAKTSGSSPLPTGASASGNVG